MPANPSNADLQRQLEENGKQHAELKEDIKAIRATLDTLAPVIAAHEERIKTTECANANLQGQTMWVVGLLSTVILGLAAWLLSHISGGKQ